MGFVSAQTIVHYQMVNEPAYITKLISVLNKTTGEVTKNRPRYDSRFSGLGHSYFVVLIAFTDSMVTRYRTGLTRCCLHNACRVLTKNTTAMVEITMHRVICIEEYKTVKALGRFMLRDKGTTIAAGIVAEVPERVWWSLDRCWNMVALLPLYGIVPRGLHVVCLTLCSLPSQIKDTAPAAPAVVGSNE